MDILFLALYPPDPPVDGGRLRTYNILKQAALRHRVTLVCFSDPLSGPEAQVRLRTMCERLVVVPLPVAARRGLREKLADLPRRMPVGLRQWESAIFVVSLRELVASREFDLAHVDHLALAQYQNALRSLPVVLTHHNVEGLAQQRAHGLAARGVILQYLARSLETQRWVKFEIDASRKANALITVSESDAKYFRRHAPAVPVYVVPNGVDTDYFQPLNGVRRQLLFTGRMDYGPNIDAVLWFCAQIFPLIRQTKPDMELVVVGRAPGPVVRALGEIAGVTVTGSVEDVRPYYGQAAVFVAPLRAGGGTRLKILEAMAMGVPSVSTTLGSEGLEVTPEVDLLCADDPEAFARQVLRILDDPALAARLSEHARCTAVKRYAWPVVTAELEHIYRAHVRTA